jgi:hypothetical protein
MLENPHNFPVRTSALKAEKKDRAIWCDSSWGPIFGGDIYVLQSLQRKRPQFYRTVLTGSLHFTVKEIEVFEITD